MITCMAMIKPWLWVNCREICCVLLCSACDHEKDDDNDALDITSLLKLDVTPCSDQVFDVETQSPSLVCTFMFFIY